MKIKRKHIQWGFFVFALALLITGCICHMYSAQIGITCVAYYCPGAVVLLIAALLYLSHEPASIEDKENTQSITSSVVFPDNPGEAAAF